MVTRPLEQSAKLSEQLRALGAHTLVWPLLVIDPVSDQQAAALARVFHDACSRPGGCWAWIFISANAVREFFRVNKNARDLVKQWPVCYAIGEATSARLREQGIQARVPEQGMNSEALLAMSALQDVTGKRIVLCRGEGGRTLLTESLRRRGADVVELPLYRRRCPTSSAAQMRQAMNREAINTVVLSSGEILQNFVRLIDAEVAGGVKEKLQIVVPSARVAELASSAGFTRIATAKQATDQGVIDALLRLTNGLAR